MRRRIAILTMVFLAFCARDGKHHAGAQHLRSVGIQSGNGLVPAGSRTAIRAKDGHMLYTLSATLPPGLDIRDDWQQPVLLDDTGSRHRFISSSLIVSDDDPMKIAATFEVPNGRRPQVMIVGKYRIDFTQSLITDETVR